MANEKLVTLSQLSRNNDKIKEELNKKIDVKQGVNNTNKILQVNAEGNLALVDMPDEVKISQEEGNAITEKDDGIYVPSVSETNISAEEGNAIVKKDDGLYVATPEEIKISEKENNQLTEEIDGLYVPSIDLTDYAKTEDVETLIDEAHYTTSVVSAHYEITDSTTENALEVVADGTATDGQIDISSVTPLLDGVTVSDGDYVIWVEAVTTKDAKFLVEADLDPYVAEEEIKVMTEEELLEKLGLSEEELQGLAQLISDTEVRIDKTYSSSKITEVLQKNLNSSRQYTLEQIAQSSGAVYKVVPSIDEMVDAKYIYLLENESVYDLYIYDEDSQTVTKVGDTSVNLKGYYTQGESDDLFVHQTDFDTLSDNVGDVNTLTTSEKTIVTAINEAYSTIVSAHTYTTSETVVGTWVDGKPIYRRVIQSNGVHLVNQQEGQLVGIYLIPNMGTVVSQHISFAESYNIDKCCQSIPYTTGDSTPFIISYNANNGYFTAVNANIFAESFDFVFTAIIEYTKTTDNV